MTLILKLLTPLFLIHLLGALSSSGNEEPPKVPNDFARGLEIAQAVVREYGVADDQTWNDRLTTIGYKVASAVESRTIPFVFNSVMIDEANAFALPGGFIFITEGMRNIELTDDELAHLIGHEMAHSNLKHIAKMERKAALWNVLNHAILAGILFGMKDSSSSYHGPVGPAPYQGDDGKTAAFKGALVFGQLFQDLMQRGYSREIEFEADETGFRYATDAGFDPVGGVSLLEKLHQRFYEAPGMHYWRTHPYFFDRVKAARSRTSLGVGEQSAETCRRRREELQTELIAFAKLQKDKDRRELLYTAALAVDPQTVAAAEVSYELAVRALQDEQVKVPIMRDYAKTLGKVDTAIASLSAAQSENPKAEELQKARTQILTETATVHASYCKAIDEGTMTIQSLIRFIDIYPDDPLRLQAHYLLGENYRLLGEEDKAVNEYLNTIEVAKRVNLDSQWPVKAERALTTMIPNLQELSACYSIISRRPGFAEEATARLKALCVTFDDLVHGGKFLKKWPDSEFSEQVKTRLNQLGEQRYVHGRQLEAIGQYQKAMELYAGIVQYVPSDELLQQTNERIEYLQRQAEES